MSEHKDISLTEGGKNHVAYFERIDVIRFVAAIMVVIYHAYQGWVSKWHYLKVMTIDGDQQNLNTIGKWIHTALMNGGYGVEIFFIISGFLITYLLLKEKEMNNGKVNFLKFYARRTLRIWPLYYIVILLAPFIIKFVQQPYEPNYMANIFFYNNFDTMQNHYWVFPLAHFWSLCIEEHFYLLWPFIIAFVPNKYLIRVFAGLVFGSIVYRAYLFTNVTEPWYPLFLSTFSRFDALVAGAATAYWHFSRPINLSISRVTRLFIYLVFIIAVCNDSLIVWDSFFAACFKKYFYMAVVLFAILNFLFNDKPMFEFMNNKVFRYFGKVSFGLYVYGLIVLEIVIKRIMEPYGINNLYLYWLLILAGTILVAIISYELFEKQILKFKKKFEVVRSEVK